VGFIYKPQHKRQLGPGSGPTGKYDCTAWSAAMAIDRATLGGTDVTGRQVRLASNEPYPDPDSPGLHLGQVVDVAFKWHVDLENRSGAPWSAVLQALKAGRGVILQGDYDQLVGFSCQATFKGDHAVYVNHITGDDDLYWMDPLCPGPNANMKVTIARKYAEKFAKSRGVYPGILFATTRRTPTIAEAQ
jgi:hypothetical protein